MYPYPRLPFHSGQYFLGKEAELLGEDFVAIGMEYHFKKKQRERG
jgi:hypothetical protein